MDETGDYDTKWSKYLPAAADDKVNSGITENIPPQKFQSYFPHSKYLSCKISNIWSLTIRYTHSVQFSHSVVSNSLQHHGLQHARLPCRSPTPWACSNSHPSSWWGHPTISSSAIPFSSHLQSFSASGSFQMRQFFSSGGQNIGPATSASVLPMNIQDWFPLGLTRLISLQCKGLSRVFSNTTAHNHQFFGAQLSLWSRCHIQKKP